MKIQTDVEAVLLNGKCPNNIPVLINALRNQSYPCKITLIDRASTPEYQIPEHVSQNVDQFVRIPQQPFHGSIRVIFSGHYEKKYILLIDDNMKPGTDCVRHFRECAEKYPQTWLWGQWGYRTSQGLCNAKNVERNPDHPVPVDLCIRAYFIHLEVEPYIRRVAQKIQQLGMMELFQCDDMLLATACRLAGKAIHLTPEQGPETQVETIENPEDQAILRQLTLNSKQDQFRKNAWAAFQELS